MEMLQWEVVIVDEGHRLKNDQSRLAGALAALSTRARFLLTGTPLHNRLGELWALLHFLLPSVFSSVASFDAWFGDAFCGNSAVRPLDVLCAKQSRKPWNNCLSFNACKNLANLSSF